MRDMTGENGASLPSSVCFADTFSPEGRRKAGAARTAPFCRQDDFSQDSERFGQLPAFST